MVWQRFKARLVLLPSQLVLRETTCSRVSSKLAEFTRRSCGRNHSNNSNMQKCLNLSTAAKNFGGNSTDGRWQSQELRRHTAKICKGIQIGSPNVRGHAAVTSRTGRTQVWLHRQNTYTHPYTPADPSGSVPSQRSWFKGANLVWSAPVRQIWPVSSSLISGFLTVLPRCCPKYAESAHNVDMAPFNTAADVQEKGRDGRDLRFSLQHSSMKMETSGNIKYFDANHLSRSRNLVASKTARC